jgi:hypothetical protein
MKRFRITNELKDSIKSSNQSLRELNKILSFEVRNILNKNKSVNEIHLKKIEKVLNKKFNLEEIKFDSTKNLGKYSFTNPIKKINSNKEKL